MRGKLSYTIYEYVMLFIKLHSARFISYVIFIIRDDVYRNKLSYESVNQIIKKIERR